ncbi:MAG: STAS/SEC14 domain-containing protein [Deltaproteobacteria bacterium]|nr:MAG: STAS/SEC14 domain-containing protein [Deltaproteobacteria bacterium]
MLEMVDVGDENIIAYRLGGKITEEEMTSVLSIFREKIDKGEKLNVYQEVLSIGGAEFDAMIEKFKFFKQVGFNFSHFSKIAVVTQSKWLHKIVDLEDKIFRNTDMRGFPVEEKDKAIEFLKDA